MDFYFDDEEVDKLPEYYNEEMTLDISTTNLDGIRGKVLIEDEDNYFTPLTEEDFGVLSVCTDIVPNGLEYVMICNFEEALD